MEQTDLSAKHANLTRFWADLSDTRSQRVKHDKSQAAVFNIDGQWVDIIFANEPLLLTWLNSIVFIL